MRDRHAYEPANVCFQFAFHFLGVYFLILHFAASLMEDGDFLMSLRMLDPELAEAMARTVPVFGLKPETVVADHEVVVKDHEYREEDLSTAGGVEGGRPRSRGGALEALMAGAGAGRYWSTGTARAEPNRKEPVDHDEPPRAADDQAPVDIRIADLFSRLRVEFVYGKLLQNNHREMLVQQFNAAKYFFIARAQYSWVDLLRSGFPLFGIIYSVASLIRFNDFRTRGEGCRRLCRRLLALDQVAAVQVLHLLEEVTPRGAAFLATTTHDGFSKGDKTHMLELLERYDSHYHLLGSHLSHYRGADYVDRSVLMGKTRGGFDEEEIGSSASGSSGGDGVDTILIACAYFVLAYHATAVEDRTRFFLEGVGFLHSAPGRARDWTSEHFDSIFVESAWPVLEVLVQLERKILHTRHEPSTTSRSSSDNDDDNTRSSSPEHDSRSSEIPAADRLETVWRSRLAERLRSAADIPTDIEAVEELALIPTTVSNVFAEQCPALVRHANMERHRQHMNYWYGGVPFSRASFLVHDPKGGQEIVGTNANRNNS